MNAEVARLFSQTLANERAFSHSRSDEVTTDSSLESDPDSNSHPLTSAPQPVNSAPPPAKQAKKSTSAAQIAYAEAVSSWTAIDMKR